MGGARVRARRECTRREDTVPVQDDMECRQCTAATGLCPQSVNDQLREEIGVLSYAKCLLVLPEPLLLGMGNKFPIGQQLPSRNDRVLKCPFALSNPSSPCNYWQADRILIICRAGEQTAFVCMR